jgi:hypothetical protein
MPSFADWLRASWGDFRRRWAVLLAVAGLGGGAAILAGFLPFLPAAAATMFGVGPAWAVWGGASAVSLTGVLWLSTWAQAAMMRAALTEEKTGECLSRAWGQTAAFAWVLSLALLAIAGGYYLLVIPGLLLSVLLFAAPFCQISGEAEGVRALGLSWARVRPRFGAVALRLFAATALTAAPGWIPYVGWIVMMFWAPFSFIAFARLEKDLRAAEPDAVPPEWMGRAVAGLAGVFVLVTVLVSLAAVRGVRAAVQSINDSGGLAARVRPETAQSLIASFSGEGTEDERRKLISELLLELRTPPAAASSPSAQVIVSSSPWGTR